MIDIVTEINATRRAVEAGRDRADWAQSSEAREFMARSSQAWGAAHETSGATAAEAGAAAEQTTRFYTGEPQAAE